MPAVVLERATSAPKNKPAILIIARSARMLAAAACAHWSPWTIDCFADSDLQQLTTRWHRFAATGALDFDTSLYAAVDAVLAEAGPLPIVAGSGFEHAPQLVAGLAARARVLGASAALLRRLTDVPSVFASLAADPAVYVPPTVAERPRHCDGWLSKQAGNCGGAHVRWAAGGETSTDRYFQRFIAGTSASGIFIAADDHCELVALNRHLRWSSRPGFDYQGAVTWHGAPPRWHAVCLQLGRAVAAELGLRGLFGLDFICGDDERPALIDINPRPPASLDLCADRGALFSAHVAACTGEPLLYSRSAPAGECGHLVLYAQAPWQVPAQFDWPVASADRPCAGERIEPGWPLCTVRVTAPDTDTVLTGLASAVEELRERLAASHADVVPPAITISILGGSNDDRPETR